MIKLITPPGMLVTVALLAIYCAYASWTAFIERSWLYAVVALFIFLRDGGWFLGPFLLVYVGGLLWLGIQELRERRHAD